jgi:hypothetical protein
MDRFAAALNAVCPTARACYLGGTSLPKQGTHSVGVARQYCGGVRFRRPTAGNEAAYVTLAKIHFSAGRSQEGMPCSNSCCRGIQSMPSPWNCSGNGRAR